MSLHPGSRITLLSGLLLAFQLVVTSAGAEPLGAARERAVRAATFEVVMRRPDADPLSYERPLPLDLLPFSVRNDPFVPIGTAFAIGDNQFVTAAHVVLAGVGSLFEGPMLRAADGQVYAVSAVTKYSGHEDFAVLAVADPPQVRPLAVQRKPTVNQPVHAVGNALGGGIVIRGGLFTSTTPEDQAGRWQWLRFSAAASPGNSGGPLLDAAGRVIGLIVAASPNENLNYALPIERVLDAPADRALFDLRLPFALPVTPLVVSLPLQAEFALPRSPAEFGAAVTRMWNQHYDAAYDLWVETHGGQFFPNGTSAEKLLRRSLERAEPLRLLQMGRGGDWESKWASDRYTVSLDGRGQIEVGSVPGAALMDLQLDETGRASLLVEDSVAQGNLVARGLRLTRFVGPEQVAVTSLARATSEAVVEDRWGRKWLFRAWPLAFADSMVVSLSLPVPDGMLVLARFAAARDQHSARRELQVLADLTQPKFYGTLVQWQDYLALEELRPRLLRKLALDFELGRKLNLRLPRIALRFTDDVQAVDPGSTLELDLRYVLDVGDPRWALVGVSLAETRDSVARVSIERASPPADDAQGEPLRRYWAAMLAAEEPFDGLQNQRDGRRFAIRAYPDPSTTGGGEAAASAVWLVSLSVPTKDVSEQEFDRRNAALLRGFQILE